MSPDKLLLGNLFVLSASVLLSVAVLSGKAPCSMSGCGRFAKDTVGNFSVEFDVDHAQYDVAIGNVVRHLFERNHHAVDVTIIAEPFCLR